MGDRPPALFCDSQAGFTTDPNVGSSGHPLPASIAEEAYCQIDYYNVTCLALRPAPGKNYRPAGLRLRGGGTFFELPNFYF
jgi:hypothetical protein